MKATVAAILLLSFSASIRARAALGDGKILVDQIYGKPTSSLKSDDPEKQLWVYHSKPYKIIVTFRKGKVVEEAFFRTDSKPISPTEISSFLRLQSEGKSWQEEQSSVPSSRFWHRDGARATYLHTSKLAAISASLKEEETPAVASTTSSSEPATSSPSPLPGKTVATINGSGSKTSDPFTITKDGGFTVEYEGRGNLLSVQVCEATQKRTVADASLTTPGKDHTFVPADPGTYYIKVITTSGFTITVRE